MPYLFCAYTKPITASNKYEDRMTKFENRIV